MQEAAVQKKEVKCLVCNSDDYKVLGIRGNREYYGADPNATPHIYTNIVQCNHCSFIYTNPMIYGMEHLEREHYNKPEVYQRDDKSLISQMFERRLKYISKFKEGKQVLDIGAGKGEFLNAAKNNGWQVTGIEPSEEFCKYAKSQFNVEVSKGFLTKDSFTNSQFDLVTLNHVLEHVDKPKQLLSIIKDYIKKDGVLFIEVPNTTSILLHFADFFFRLKRQQWSSRLSPLHPPYHKYGYSEKSLKYLLNNTGFTVVGIKTFPEADRQSLSAGSLMNRAKNLVSTALGFFGHRELLAVVAKLNHN